VGSAADIFGKRRLTPVQLRAVAEYRFDDAICLLESGDKSRANGAMYMAGFVIECLLKAILLERHPNLQGPLDPARLSAFDREVYSLLFSHELDAMLDFLPEVPKKLNALGQTERRPIWLPFRTVCEQWTVYARYSPKRATMQEATRFMDTIREVKQWLREL
jgi:hypothetical protein